MQIHTYMHIFSDKDREHFIDSKLTLPASYYNSSGKLQWMQEQGGYVSCG